MKKFICFFLCFIMSITLLLGCGEKKVVETNPDGGYVQGKAILTSM